MQKFQFCLDAILRATKAFEEVGFTVEGIVKQGRYINGEYQDADLMTILRYKE